MGSTILAVAVSLAVAAAGCSEAPQQDSGEKPVSQAGYTFPSPPPAVAGPVAPAVREAVTRLLDFAVGDVIDANSLATLGESRDARLGWLVSDLLRFYQGSPADERLVDAFGRLTGVDVRADPRFGEGSWRTVTDDLIAWDTPAPPGYRDWKAKLFLLVEPAWKPFFDDSRSEIDWRRVSWGGVLIDDRKLGSRRPCQRGCIPALDDPKLTAASKGDWYPDDRVVFGIVVGGEAVAFPKNIMEVHEMVNVSIGGRRLGIPYCTLCGSAQAFFLDTVPSGVMRPVLRTSGLLNRSNKVMYDLVTRSVFDTFTGRALSGPLHRKAVTLPQATVVTSTWAEWKQAHPATRIVAQDGGIGRTYELDPLHGRDDNGPIFPVGDIDPRLAVQTPVVGVIAPDGRAVAFVADAARAALKAGRSVAADGIDLVADGGGLRARTSAGRELPAHQAFWFAWSQFHPGTELWRAPSG